MIKHLSFIFFLLLSTGSYSKSWNPPGGIVEIPVWPDGEIPSMSKTKGTESKLSKRKNLIGNKPWHEVTNVSIPTLTIFTPQNKSTEAAVIVFPGGGYKLLAIDLEGTEVCDWLVTKGVTCILLKYRVPNTGCHWDTKCNCHKTPEIPRALQDAQRAMKLARFNAKKWKLNPEKIGVLGFSAGGNLVAMISTHFSKKVYRDIDMIDSVSARPNFAVAIYPGHMSITHKNIYKFGETRLNPDLKFNKETPPTFLVHAQDDSVNPVEYSQLYYNALKKLNVAVEIHLFPKGGHAFGIRKSTFPISRWPSLLETWMKGMNLI